MPVHELDPSYGRLFTVARELNVPGVGFIDVVLADERGRLVIIECKLWKNPQARREVVGQILDYARELARYSYDDLQRQISVATKRSGNVLFELAQSAGSNLDEARFVDRVARDLAAGRFLLLVVGDGIAEGTRRIGEYLRAQPGLAFDFGLIEMVEYRLPDTTGVERTVMQPRLLAKTAVIERHVIRNEVPGLVIDALVTVEPSSERPSSSRPPSDAGLAWRTYIERFVAETRFDDPGQPAPRWGGMGWTKIPLPGTLYVNAWRSTQERAVGTQLRFAGGDGETAWAALAAEREAIDAEFTAAGLEAPSWDDEAVPVVVLRHPSPQPWDEAAEAAQRQWLGEAANQFVNSFRPRLQHILG
jgi:hypothetical protein